jgi:hypothetical protein
MILPRQGGGATFAWIFLSPFEETRPPSRFASNLAVRLGASPKECRKTCAQAI